MNIKEAVEKGIIEKLNGYGMCECFGCKSKTGWNRVWTSFCYRYKNKVYCGECMQELLNESFSSNIS